MSSGRTNQEIAVYTAQVISDLEEYLHFLTCKGDPDDKRADKISQWVEKWTKFLQTEKTFNPRSIPAFQRGCIVYLDFGFNVGSEYGGLHYAIVLNKKDSRKNHLLHVLPLTSIKETTDLDNLKYYQLSLGEEVHRLLIQKAINHSHKLKQTTSFLYQEVEEDAQQLIRLRNLLRQNDADDMSDDLYKFIEEEQQKLKIRHDENCKEFQKISEQSEYVERLIVKTMKLKRGSLALLNQVTTISKMRLRDPINKNSLLSDIVLSAETMDKIDRCLRKIY